MGVTKQRRFWRDFGAQYFFPSRMYNPIWRSNRREECAAHLEQNGQEQRGKGRREEESESGVGAQQEKEQQERGNEAETSCFSLKSKR